MPTKTVMTFVWCLIFMGLISVAYDLYGWPAIPIGVVLGVGVIWEQRKHMGG